jgi:hypothetical protein
MKIKYLTTVLLMTLGLSARASVVFTDTDANTVIPNNNTIGIAETVTGSGLGSSATSVTLNFTLAGGFGTDLTGYLRLGNSMSSPSYDLTSLVQGYPTISGTGLNFSVDVSSAFTGYNPNNTWTLFFADPNAGGTTTLNGGWSLSVDAVPEPVNVALGIFGGLMGLLALARSQMVKSKFKF